jgi:uncharacterized protein YgiB involved in biofilm formation
MDPSPDSDRSSRRTRAIVLTVIGAGVGLIAYNAFNPSAAEEETRSVYKNRDDCIAATNDAAKCEPSQGRGGYPHGSYFGPLFFPGPLFTPGRPAPATSPGAPAPAARPATPPQPIGEYRSQRGGFGGSSGGYSFGS